MEYPAGGDREARRLQCELCKAPIAAKLSLAPYTVIFFDRGGRNILLTTILRLTYRLFLFRRLYMRYGPSASCQQAWIPAHPLRKSNEMHGKQLPAGFEALAWHLLTQRPA